MSVFIFLVLCNLSTANMAPPEIHEWDCPAGSFFDKDSLYCVPKTCDTETKCEPGYTCKEMKYCLQSGVKNVHAVSLCSQNTCPQGGKCTARKTCVKEEPIAPVKSKEPEGQQSQNPGNQNPTTELINKQGKECASVGGLGFIWWTGLFVFWRKKRAG